MIEFDFDGDIILAGIITVITMIFALICHLIKWTAFIVGIFLGVWLICFLCGFDLIAYIGGII